MAERGHMPERTCLGCRRVLPQNDLLRYVLSPDGEVLPDYRRKLPGRGGYTCLDSRCIRDAVRNNRFDRTFRKKCLPVDAEEILQVVATQIRERIVSLLGMGRKSSCAVSGSGMVLDLFDAVESPAVILIAEDVSEGVGAKILSKAEKKGVPIFHFLDKGTLGHIVGKGERSVVALKKSSIAEAIKLELLKYKDFLGEN